MGRCGIAAKITGVRGNSGLSFSALVLTNSINQGIGALFLFLKVSLYWSIVALQCCVCFYCTA